MMSHDEVKVIVCGDREWSDSFIMGILLDGLLARYQERLVIIEGEARGADKMARAWAEAHGLTKENGRLRPYPAKWGQYGRKGKGDPAGPIRNREMLKENPQLVIGFHNDLPSSTGTKDMLEIASKAGVYTALIGSHRPPVVNQQLPM